MALSDSIWWTRKARIQTEKRLLSNAFQTQLLLLWYSVFSVFVAIYYSQFATDSNYSGVAWIAFSVMVLAVSGFINGLSFKERAALIKECYETLNGLYQRAKIAESAELSDIISEYEQILSVCENHTDRDYRVALCDLYLSHENPNDSNNGLDRKPTKFIWFLVGYYYIRRMLLLVTLYLLPVASFGVLESLCL